jgi:lipopolysaccharide heptosyltransferase I
MRILIIKLSAIGDVIHSLAFLNAMKKSFPASKISWVVSEKAFSILEGHPMLENVFVFKRDKLGKNPLNPINWMEINRSLKLLFKDIGKIKFDIAVDLQGLFKSGIITNLVNAEEKIGFAGQRELSSLFLTRKLPKYNYETHAVDRYLSIAKYLGADIENPGFPLYYNQNDYDLFEKILNDNKLLGKDIAGIIPGAGWKTKLWTSHGFSKVVTYLNNKGIKSIIIGSDADKHHASEIISQSGTNPIDFTGKTSLKVLALLYKKMKMVISTDTGPMHLADASGIPVISLFGTTAPWRTGPYHNINNVIRTGIKCSPCFRKNCTNPVCMTEISPESVIEKINKIL